MVKARIQESAAQPLAGKRILVTRARSQAGTLQQRIEALGGEVVLFPTIEIQAPASYEALDRAIRSIASYQWLIFTSVNGVDRFFDRLAPLGRSTTDLQALEIAAIGPETADRLRKHGLKCELVPKRYQAEGLLDILTAERMGGKRILIPRAAKAREILPEVLRQRGAQVDVIEAYRTVIPTADVAALIQALEKGAIDMVSFTSSSTVINFSRLVEPLTIAEVLERVPVACIGPITRGTLEELGGRATVIAGEFTIPGLVAAITEYFQDRES